MMFSSSYNSSNPFPYFLPASYPSPLPPFLSHENFSSAENTFLHDPLSLPYIPCNNNNAQIPDIMSNLAASDYAAMANKQDFTNDDHYGISSLITKKPSKKDRHSKIYTSQGLRDRRVRLSIEIARKFFDLQDMLGFDKASNTLEWLFTKSKKAIKELALSKKSSNGFARSFSSSSECEVVSEINQDHTDVILNLQGEDSNEKIVSEPKERKLKQKEAAGVRAKKESREKARARARERTNHKMCSTNGSRGVQESKKKGPEAENPQILNQLRSPIQGEGSERSPNRLVQVQSHPHHLVGSETSGDHNVNVIEESILIKRKLKPSLMSPNDQNFFIPKEGSFNHNENNSFPNFPQNWDTNGALGRSTFCAMASMNLSTELQIFGKPWEECNNQRLH